MHGCNVQTPAQSILLWRAICPICLCLSAKLPGAWTKVPQVHWPMAGPCLTRPPPRGFQAAWGKCQNPSELLAQHSILFSRYFEDDWSLSSKVVGTSNGGCYPTALVYRAAHCRAQRLAIMTGPQDCSSGLQDFTLQGHRRQPLQLHPQISRCSASGHHRSYPATRMATTPKRHLRP